MPNNSLNVLESPSRSSEQLRLLIEVSEAIASHGDLTALFRDLARRLPAIVPFEVIALFLHDPVKNVMRVHMIGRRSGPSAARHSARQRVVQRRGVEDPAA